jgi:hypothetical protein
MVMPLSTSKSEFHRGAANCRPRWRQEPHCTAHVVVSGRRVLSRFCANRARGRLQSSVRGLPGGRAGPEIFAVASELHRGKQGWNMPMRPALEFQNGTQITMEKIHG